MKKTIYFKLNLIIVLSIFNNYFTFAVDKYYVKTPFCSEKLGYLSTTEFNSNKYMMYELNSLYGGGVFHHTAEKNFTSVNWIGKDNRLGLSSEGSRNSKAIYVDFNGIYLCTESEGIYFQSTSAIEYTQKNTGLGDLSINDLEKCGSYLFAATSSHGIYMSSNNGSSWEAKNLNIETLKVNCILNYVYNNLNYIFIGTNNGVYLSTNDGDDWIQKNSGLGTNTDDKVVIDIDYDLVNSTFYLVTKSKKLCKSTDYGDNWTVEYTFGDIPSSINIAKTNSTNTNIIVSTNSTLGNVLKSTNGGYSFSPIGNLDANCKKVYDIKSYKDANSSTNIIAVATDVGVHFSKYENNNWTNWIISNKELPDEDIKDMCSLYFYDNKIYVGERGKEIFTGAEAIHGTGNLDPKYWARYNCHAFAWHISNGGDILGAMVAPNEFGYIPRVNDENGDVVLLGDNSYMKTTKSDPTWCKITYSPTINGGTISHSGIRDPDNTNFIISKWNVQNPLVRHTENELSLYKDYFKSYWTDTKYLMPISVINNDKEEKICKKITSFEIIPNLRNVRYQVSPMTNASINLKANEETLNGITTKYGFEAKLGSRFRAFIDGCSIPYTRVESGKISVDDIENETGNKNFNLNIFPNPTSEFLNVDLSEVYVNNQQSEMTVQIVNSSGIEVYRNKMQIRSFFEIPVQNLRNEFYFIKISLNNIENSEKLELSSKFIVE